MFVTSVNDIFVMNAWKKTLDPDEKSHVRFLADPSGDFATKAGFLFDPEDLESLKQALQEAYHARHSFSRASASIREEILRDHGWEARVREMIPQIQRVLGESV